MNASTTTRRRALPLLACTFAGTLALPAPAAVERISVGSTGEQANSQSRYPVVSADGRHVAFESDASNLVPGDSNDATDIFVRDRLLGTTTRVSVSASGAQLSGPSRQPAISGNGQRIVFDSFGALLPDSGFHNCYLVDRGSGAVVLLDRRADNGIAASETCHPPSISVDGNRVAFASASPFLVPGGTDGNGWADAFVRDLTTHSTVRVSRGPGGIDGDAPVDTVRIGGAGGHVIYGSSASNLVAGDSNGLRDIFLSTLGGQTRRISVGSGQVQANGASSPVSALNADGSLVAFSVKASSLPAWNVNVESVLYLRLPDSDLTVPVSLPAAGSHEGWGEEPDFSYTGRWLVFWANDQLIPGVTVAGIYVVDLLEDTIALVSRQPGGQPAGAGNHFHPRISADGRSIVWFSNSALLVAGDSNGTWDVFHADNPLWDDTLFANGFEP